MRRRAWHIRGMSSTPPGSGSDKLLRLTADLAGRYRVERELGAGGMATVYLAHDGRHDRPVAIKVLRAELAAVVGAQRFLAEIRTTANLQHPHILPLFDSGEVEGTVFYVMPYVEGESLRDRLMREKQLPVGDAVRIAGEVASALDYAHRHGVIHRDIKPENILLHDGQALVADFGIALAVANMGDGRLTETGLSLGTPTYMSPEQAMGERDIDARVDVYALGCVVYEMLTGEPPFTGATAQAIVAKLIADTPRPIRELRRSVPEYVDDAVHTALEKLPADRFASSAEFANALKGGAAPRARPTRSTGRRNKIDATTVIAAALGATTLAALAWGIQQRMSRRPAAPEPVLQLQFPVDLARMSTGGVVAISPDGSKIATTEFLPGGLETHIVVHPLDLSAPIPIAGSEKGLSPFFSPNGAWLAWTAGSRLMRARIDGQGAPTASLVTDLGTADFVDGGAWTDNETIVIATRGARLFRVNASGGPPQKILSSVAGGVNLPVALPGGTSVVVSVEQSAADYHMAVLSIADGKVLANLGTGLALGYVDAGYLVYNTPDGTLMAMPFDGKAAGPTGPPVALPVARQAFYARSRMMAISPSGTIAYAGGLFSDGELVRVGVNGVTTVLPVGQHAFRGPRFSPDGSRIALDIEEGGDLIGDVWVYDLTSSAFTRLTFENSSVFPEWMPDGASILYSTVANGKRGISKIPADRRAPPTRVVEGKSPMFEAVAAPASGMLIVRQNADSTGRDIVSTSLDAKAPLAPVSAGPFQERSPTVSPDGRYLAFASDESGRDEVYVQPIAGTGRVPVSAGGGSEPRWAPSGKEIYYWSRDTLYAAPVVASTALAIGSRRFVLTGHYAREPFHANYDVAPDGKSFVLVRPVQSRDARGLYVVLNWFAARAAAR
jgi:eukaryotic-like serine/threonine-protein kinase